MSTKADTSAENSNELAENSPKTSCPRNPPQELNLNLDLYNYDSPDAQSCPYVLTSPRSLEACSRIGVKPVDLLHKTLAEFSDEVEPDKPLEEIVKLYDEHEQQRIILLQKCQAEREFLIWRSTSKRRSHSLSPCRRDQIHNKPKSRDSHSAHSHSFRLASRRKSSDDLLSPSDDFGHEEHGRSHSASVKNLPRGGQPTSWSTPTSPYYQGSRNLFVRIVSPTVCAKLQSFPKAKMRLPPKDMKILEVILQKYEKLEEEEEKKARAQKRWDQEKEYREKEKEEAEMERWKSFALRQRSNSEEHLKTASENSTPTHVCSRYQASDDTASEKSTFHKRHSYKAPKNLTRSYEEPRNPQTNYSSERLSRLEAEQKLKEIQTKQDQVRKRRLDIINKRDELLRRSADEFKEKLKQVKTNQEELDKALEDWQQQVLCYQEVANSRASEKVAQSVEQKRLKVMQDRINKQEEHKKNMRRIKAEDYIKLQEMMEKLRSKDERCKAFKEERNSCIEQSRQLALAASDLRDLIRQRLDKDSFRKKSQQAALESRLMSIKPRSSRSREPKTPDKE